MKHTLGLLLIGALVALGAFLSLDSRNATSTAAFGATVTFTKDVAPIIQKNCMVCHRPGEVAPMSFTNYKEVRPWARSIREKVISREMPPWFADPQHGEFSNDVRLSQKEIDTIIAWVEGGAKEGASKDLPLNPKFTEGWQIGKPDVVLSMTEEYAIPTTGVIDYKYFAVPTNFTEDKYVQFAEIRQGDRQHVHHVIVDVRYPEHGNLPKPGLIKPEDLAASRAQQQRRTPRRFRRPGGRLGARRSAADAARRAGQANQEGIGLDLPGALHNQRRSGRRPQQHRPDLLQTAGRQARHHGGRGGAQPGNPARRAQPRNHLFVHFQRRQPH